MKIKPEACLWVSTIGLAMAVAYIAGCKDHNPPTTAPLPLNTPSTEVVRALLKALTEANRLRSSASSTEETRKACDEVMSRIRSLGARNKIYQIMRKDPSRTLPVDLTEEMALKLAAESWASTAAYYADGFQDETLQVPVASRSPGIEIQATIEAIPPQDEVRLKRIEESLAQNPPKGADGKPVLKGSPAYQDLVRARALGENPPFNVPIRAKLEIGLTYTDDGWRVYYLRVVPAATPGVPPAPSAVPAVAPPTSGPVAPAPSPPTVPPSMPQPSTQPSELPAAPPPGPPPTPLGGSLPPTSQAAP